MVHRLISLSRTGIILSKRTQAGANLPMNFHALSHTLMLPMILVVCVYTTYTLPHTKRRLSIKYMNKHYFCLYKVLEILTTRSKQDVGALSKGTDKLLQASLSLGELCRSSFPKVGSIFLDGALHYIEGEIETESTRDDFRANLAWVLSKACDGGVYKSWQATLKLPNVTKSCTDETRKTFAVQSFARCTLIVAMTIEALKVWGKYDVDNGIPDEFYCQMRCALLKATKVSVADNLTEKVLYLLQVYSIPTAYAEALIRGLRGVLWSVESSVDITVEMLEKHEALLKEVLNNG